VLAEENKASGHRGQGSHSEHINSLLSVWFQSIKLDAYLQTIPSTPACMIQRQLFFTWLLFNPSVLLGAIVSRQVFGSRAPRTRALNVVHAFLSS
jgi:hypothetical protein